MWVLRRFRSVPSLQEAGIFWGGASLYKQRPAPRLIVGFGMVLYSQKHSYRSLLSGLAPGKQKKEEAEQRCAEADIRSAVRTVDRAWARRRQAGAMMAGVGRAIIAGGIGRATGTESREPRSQTKRGDAACCSVVFFKLTMWRRALPDGRALLRVVSYVKEVLTQTPARRQNHQWRRLSLLRWRKS